MQALLMFIVTTLILFLLVALIEVHTLPVFYVIGIGYLCWSAVTPLVVKLPVGWIYESADQNAESVVQRDSQLILFEKNVIAACAISGVLSVVSLILNIVASHVK
jgi:hypothetical protein